MPVTSSQPGSSPCALDDVDAEAERARLDLVDLAEELLEAALRAALSDLRVPAAALRRGALEDAAEELDALVEVERLEGVDAERLEEAARRVQVLLVGGRVADERDALAPTSIAFAHSLTEAIPEPITM